jgi:hypothetical protein
MLIVSAVDTKLACHAVAAVEVMVQEVVRREVRLSFEMEVCIRVVYMRDE